MSTDGLRLVDGWYLPGVDRDQDAIAEQAADVALIDVAMKHCNRHTTVIQAGGRVGLWPQRLASHFSRVYAFEPEPENYRCCLLNTAEYSNVSVRRQALLDYTGWANLARQDNDGLHYIDTRDPDAITVQAMTIDHLGIYDVAAIFLDVEGTELLAIEGGRETIEQCRPMIVCEENALCQRYGFRQGDIEHRLGRLGYKLAETFSQVKPTPRNPFPGSNLIFVSA